MATAKNSITENLDRMAKGLNSLLEKAREFLTSGDAVKIQIGSNILKNFSNICEQQIRICAETSIICDFSSEEEILSEEILSLKEDVSRCTSAETNESN